MRAKRGYFYFAHFAVPVKNCRSVKIQEIGFEFVFAVVFKLTPMNEDMFKKWNELQLRKTYWGDPGVTQCICDKIQELEYLESQNQTTLPDGHLIHEVKWDLKQEIAKRSQL